MSVRWSVGRSVGWSVERSEGRKEQGARRKVRVGRSEVEGAKKEEAGGRKNPKSKRKMKNEKVVRGCTSYHLGLIIRMGIQKELQRQTVTETE